MSTLGRCSNYNHLPTDNVREFDHLRHLYIYYYLLYYHIKPNSQPGILIDYVSYADFGLN